MRKLRRTRGNRNFTSVFGDRTYFVRKGCAGRATIAILLQFLAIEPRQPRFVRKGCVSRRLVGTAPRLKREIEKNERARGQESQRAREQEGKRARGQEIKRARENVR